MRKSIKYGGLFLVALSFFWVGYQIILPETQAFLNLYSTPEYTKLDKSKPLRDQVRIFEMAGREFEIPIMYINGSPKPQKHQDSMLLQVIWPDMKAVPELSGKDEYKKMVREEKRWGQILLEPASIRPSLDIQVESIKRGIKKEQRKEDYLGLEQYDWYSGQVDNLYHSSTVFLGKDKHSKIINFIICHRRDTGKVQFRLCSHKFMNQNIIFEIDYNESRFLKEWNLQHQRAVNFINSLEIKSETITKPE